MYTLTVHFLLLEAVLHFFFVFCDPFEFYASYYGYLLSRQKRISKIKSISIVPCRLLHNLHAQYGFLWPQAHIKNDLIEK